MELITQAGDVHLNKNRKPGKPPTSNANRTTVGFVSVEYLESLQGETSVEECYKTEL